MLSRETPKSLTEALSLIKASGWASVREMADWTGRDDATIYEWLRPDGPEPKWNDIRLICRHSGDTRIQMALGHAFFAGTAVRCDVANSPAVAANPQGVLGGLLDAMAELSDFAAKTKTALADGAICAKDRAMLQAESHQAQEALMGVLKALDAMAEKTQPVSPRLVIG